MWHRADPDPFREEEEGLDAAGHCCGVYVLHPSWVLEQSRTPAPEPGLSVREAPAEAPYRMASIARVCLGDLGRIADVF